MPRQNVYMKQKTLDGIRHIVDERLAEGMTTAEANISGVCSELLEIGLRIYSNSKNKTDVEEDQEDIYRKTLLEESIKAGLAAQQILKMMFDLEEIKGDSRHNYAELCQQLRDKKEKMVDDALSE